MATYNQDPLSELQDDIIVDHGCMLWDDAHSENVPMDQLLISEAILGNAAEIHAPIYRRRLRLNRRPQFVFSLKE